MFFGLIKHRVCTPHVTLISFQLSSPVEEETTNRLWRQSEHHVVVREVADNITCDVVNDCSHYQIQLAAFTYSLVPSVPSSFSPYRFGLVFYATSFPYNLYFIWSFPGQLH